MLVGHELEKIKAEHPDLEVIPIEITTYIGRALKAGIRGFPALKIEDDILVGFILTPKAVRQFVEKHLNLN